MMDGKMIDQDPMRMPTWSLGMAMAWIACREIEGASELWSYGLESAWFEDENISLNRAFLDAETVLKNALEDGSMAATGLLDGQRIVVPTLHWVDMQITYGWEDKQPYRSNEEPGLTHRATTQSGATYTDLRVNRVDVLQHWPAKQTTSSGKRDRGPKPVVLETVKKKMVEYNNVNRRPKLTPDRRPILTPLSDGFWR